MKNEVLKVIQNRRSTRRYREEQIKDQELQTILQAAIQAPSAMNRQPWHFTVIQNKAIIDHMNVKSKEMMIKDEAPYVSNVGKSATHIFYNAPTLIIVSGKSDVDSALVDCSAAIENMLIAAESINLGTVWIGFIKWLFKLEDEVEKLELPEGYEPFYAVSVGYKESENVKGVSQRNENVINYLK